MSGIFGAMITSSSLTSSCDKCGRKTCDRFSYNINKSSHYWIEVKRVCDLRWMKFCRLRYLLQFSTSVHCRHTARLLPAWWVYRHCPKPWRCLYSWTHKLLLWGLLAALSSIQTSRNHSLEWLSARTKEKACENYDEGFLNISDVVLQLPPVINDCKYLWTKRQWRSLTTMIKQQCWSTDMMLWRIKDKFSCGGM